MNIIRTIFTDHKSGDISYGFRAYDDTGCTYCTGMLQDELLYKDENFLILIIEQYADEVFDDMFRVSDEIIIDDTNYNIDRNIEPWKLVAI